MPSSPSSSSDEELFVIPGQPNMETTNIYIRTSTTSSTSSSITEELTEVHQDGDSGQSEDAEDEREADEQEESLQSLIPQQMRSPGVSPRLTPQAVDTNQEDIVPCRICTELTNAGFESVQEFFMMNRRLRELYLPERQLCACPVQNDGNHKVHSICLQRWVRVTGDRPCSRCRQHYNAPSHLTRANDFFGIISTFYTTELVFSLWLLNVWLFKDLMWTMLAEWEHFNFDTDLDTMTWIFGRVRWFNLLFVVVPFMNIFVLQYFYLLYSAVRTDLSMITFEYKLGPVEVYQMYSAQMVAAYNVRRSVFKPGLINYGALWTACSHCGRPLDDHEYLRNICHCYGFHRTCLKQVLNLDPNSPTVSSSRCPNCAAHFSFSARHYLYCARDALFFPIARSQAILRYLAQARYFPMPRREPSFSKYLFGTSLGIGMLVKFLVAIQLYIAVEVYVFNMNQSTSVQFVTAQLADLLCYLTTQWNTFWLGASPFQAEQPIRMDQSSADSGAWHSNLWFYGRILWFIGEFVRVATRAYLDDFDQQQFALKSHFVF